MPSLALTPEQGMATVAEETVVPVNTHADATVDSATLLSEAEASQAHIYFKDLKLLAHDHGGDDSDEEDEEDADAQQLSPYFVASEGGSSGAGSPMGRSGTVRCCAPVQLSPVNAACSPSLCPASSSSAAGLQPRPRRRLKRVDRQKLVIVMVGLPARGKTFLCNKIMCYFNWLGHPTRHFNVGNYRRRQALAGEVQDASFFDRSNPAGMEARQRALLAALDDMEGWLLDSDEAQVAIFDATNSTSARRNFLRDRLHGRVQYMYLETIITDQALLERNYRAKMRFSPDYSGMGVDAALADFTERIRKYEAVYETIADRTMHYVKLIDMTTGRGHMDVNRISGYIPGKLVFYLMQVCKALGRPRRIWLTRHGESEYNVGGRIGGNSALSRRGAAYAQLLPEVLASRVPASGDGRPVPVAVWTSTLERTIVTASGLPYPKVQWKALDEIQAGVCDGMTYPEIAERMPAEHAARKADKLRYRYPSGESYMDVVQRLEPVVIEVERERECVCIVAHQAVLRALYGYFMNRPLGEVPRIPIPLHTLMELTPKADGTMAETRFHVNVDRALKETCWVQDGGNGAELRSPLHGSSLPASPELAMESSAGPLEAPSSTGFTRSISMAELAAADVVTAQQLGTDAAL